MSITVVVSGSRSIKALPIEAKTSLDTIMAKGFKVLVGDCYGVDKLVQQYLLDCGYANVEVWHAYAKPRNMLNKSWSLNGGFTSYTARDRAMCAAAQYGLAIWDGQSPGTLANIRAVKTKVIGIGA